MLVGWLMIFGTNIIEDDRTDSLENNNLLVTQKFTRILKLKMILEKMARKLNCPRASSA